MALVGGGSNPRPGEISLAHNGVLFFDELPEFDRRVLDSLREPLETGHIVISRATRQAEFPANVQLIAAMNPCPCGYLGDSRHACTDIPLIRFSVIAAGLPAPFWIVLIYTLRFHVLSRPSSRGSSPRRIA